MVLMNYVELKTDVPKQMHFTDHYVMERTIWDKELKAEKALRTHVFAVDWEDGEIVLKTYSITSDQHAAQMAVYCPESRFRDFLFTITRTGSGFMTRYQVEAQPLPANFPI